MKKTEVLDYLKTTRSCMRGDYGSASLLAEMLEVSGAAVSRFGDIIPVNQAIKLHRLLRDPKKIEKYGLPAKGKLRFDMELY